MEIGYAAETEIELRDQGDDDTVTHIEMDSEAIVDPSFFSLVWTLAALGFYQIDENFDAAGVGKDFRKGLEKPVVWIARRRRCN